MQRRIIITGPTSFIGLALIREIRLKSPIDELIVLTRRNSSRNMLLNELNVKFIECDLDELDADDIYLKIKHADMFVHIAWSSDFENPRYNLEGQLKNVEYLKEAIDLATKCGCNTFLCIGSQAECGVLNKPITENTIENPLTAYAKAKCIAYEEGIKIAEKNGIRFCWPRLLSAYGPYDRPSTLISACMNAARNEKKIELTECEQIWDYIYVEDVAQAIICILENGRHGVKYTVASGIGRPLYEYVSIVAEVMEYRSLLDGIGKKEYVVGQPKYLVGDISTLVHDTGFRINVDFETGIKRLKAMDL